MDEFNKTIEELNKKLDRIVDILERTDKRFEKYEPVLDSYCKLFDECNLSDDNTIKQVGRSFTKGLEEHKSKERDKRDAELRKMVGLL